MRDTTKIIGSVSTLLASTAFAQNPQMQIQIGAPPATNDQGRSANASIDTYGGFVLGFGFVLAMAGVLVIIWKGRKEGMLPFLTGGAIVIIGKLIQSWAAL